MLLLEQVWFFLEGKQRSAEVSWVAIIDVLILLGLTSKAFKRQMHRVNCHILVTGASIWNSLKIQSNLSQRKTIDL